MSKFRRKKINETKKIVERFVEYLEDHNFSVSQAYLFGSFAKGNFHKFSDIDVAIVSNKFKKNWNNNEDHLWQIRHNIDVRIEPIGYQPKDFTEKDPLVYEIKNFGVRIK